MAVIAATRRQLEQAAEQTIAAAGAALLWAGEDSHGVLAHVAGTSRAEMVKSRQSYAVLRHARNFVAAEAQEGFDEELSGIVLHCEIAALPAGAVPQWELAVSEAMNEASGDKEAGWSSDGCGIVLPQPDAAVQRRAGRGSVRYHALYVCSLWGQDPLPLNQIEFLAQVVLNTALPPQL